MAPRKPKNTEAVTDLKDIAKATSAVSSSQTKAQAAADPDFVRVSKKDAQGRSYATGRRKDATARVWIKPGSGKVVVNGKTQEAYFGRPTHLLVLNQPFFIANRVNHFDVMCTVKGGGLSGQAGAIRHGISQALQLFDPELRSPLKAAGMLTRDARSVERKKVGLHKARRAKQWVKR
jgi:small subunit ribosomal protein S9